MPNVDDQLRALLEDAAPRPTTSGLDERLARRRRARALRRRIGKTALVVLVFVGTAAGFVTLRAAFEGDTTVPGGTSSSPATRPADLGLGFPICRVSSMPIQTTAGSGVAYVFTRVTDAGCPTQREGYVGVGVDVDDDGQIDATSGPLTDCFFVCDLFATPDINGDGTDEVMTSNAGADGYGITAFAITGERVDELVSLDPIVVDGKGVGFVRPGPMTFGWVGAAAHRGLASCTTTSDGEQAFTIESADVGQNDTTIADTTLVLDGRTATVVATDVRTVSIAETPDPGTTLCGQRVRLPEGPIPESTRASTAPADPACAASDATGDVSGDGVADLIRIVRKKDGECSPNGTWELLVDLGSAGVFEDTLDPGCRSWCTPYAVVDLNGDGTDEILVDQDHLVPPVSAAVGVYGWTSGGVRPATFPNPDHSLGTRDANEFPIQNSWQGYAGAYCTAPDTFWLWTGATNDGGSLTGMTATAYRLDRATLRFEPTGVTSSGTGIPKDTGYDGSICGALAPPLG